MESGSTKVSTEHAREALETLHHARRQANEARRPPAWYLVSFGALAALFTYAYAQMRHENLWALGLGAAFVLLILLAIIHHYRFRLAGVRLKQQPGGLTGHAASLVLTLVIVAIMAGSREASLQGLLWIPYAGAVANATMTWLFARWTARLP